MKENTNNKIAFCWACGSPLTGNKTMFCNETCAASYGRIQSNRDLGKKKMWVYLNKGMLDLARFNGAQAHECSAFIHTGHDLVAVALFDTDALDAIGDNELLTYEAYWREVGRLNISIEPHHPKQMRDEGILGYLCDHFGISTEKHIACAIGELVVVEGLKDPIELFNSL
jgi:hypothetical protein